MILDGKRNDYWILDIDFKLITLFRLYRGTKGMIISNAGACNNTYMNEL